MRLFNIFTVTAALLTTGCTLISDFSECDADDECQSNYGASSVCVDGVCEAPKDIISGACDVEGFPPLGPIDDPETFNIGVIFSVTGTDGAFGEPLLNAVRLAWKDFDAIGINGRDVGLIICDSESDGEIALEAGQQLVEKARVPAIIGPEFSSHTIDIANDFAIENQTLIMSPAATAVLISDLNDDNLVWRTTPSDNAQVEGIARMIELLIEQDDTIELGTATVWVLSIDGDQYSGGLRDGLVEKLDSQLTNSSSFIPLSYPGDDWADSWYAETALGNPDPDIVAILGFSEGWDIAEQIEMDKTSQPFFIMADGGRVTDEAAETNPALEGRILGTAPRNVGDPEYTPYKNFQAKYSSEYSTNPNNDQFVAHAYDAFFAVALGAAAQGFTGPEIALGLTRLSDKDAEEVSVNQQGAQRAMRLFSEGSNIDLQGASGDIDFNANGEPEETSAVISLWCFENGDVPERGTIIDGGVFTPLDCTQSEL